jgi:uncharacterized protein YbaP (TraB family)
MKKIVLVFAMMMTTWFISAQKLENTLLWEITGNGLEKPSYLFGTIHVACDATLSPKVIKALDETSQVVLEIDLDDPMMQMKMMKGMMMKDGKTLNDFVSDAEYQTIDSLFIKNMGMSIGMFKRVKPSLLSAMMIPKLLDCSIQSVDGELMRIAKEQKEEVSGLETLEYQMSVFDAIPYEDQVKELLRSANDNLAFDKATIKEMLNVYKEENITRMLSMMDEDDTSIMNEHSDKMLDIRNTNWIPEIGKFAKKEPTFFGVGAAHLAGEKGVINLLREAGYTVTPVMK